MTSSGEWLTSSLQDARILIVDDEKAQCGHLARVVEEWGAIPIVAQTTEMTKNFTGVQFMPACVIWVCSF